MLIEVFTPAEYLKIDAQLEYKFNGISYYVTPHQIAIRHLVEDGHILEGIGGVDIREVKSHPIIYSKSELAAELDQSDMKCAEIGNVASRIGHQITYFLWFVKDNSVSTGTTYSCDLENGMLVKFDRHGRHTNSKGEVETVEFTVDELTEAHHLMVKYNEIAGFKKGDIDSAFVPKAGVHINPENLILPDKLNRLQKAYISLQLARTASLVPMKIALYISALECLFTKENGELTHRVSERVALYLETNRIEALEIFKDVKKAYNVRSSFVHGTKSDINDFKKYTDISEKIDAILRRVLKKVILEDSSIFLVAKKEEQSLDTYFTSLVFRE